MNARRSAKSKSVLLLLIAGAFLIPSLLAVPNAAETAASPTGALCDGHSSAVCSLGAQVTPSGSRNETNLISDGNFTTNPGPWVYTNGTSGVVTASPDPSLGARIGATAASLLFDSMDNITGSSPWKSAVSGSGSATSTLTQVASPNADGYGSMRDNVTFLKSSATGGAVRSTTGAWNWTGYNRLALWIDLATPGTYWTWVVVTDQNGNTSWGGSTLVTGWNRYPVQLNSSLLLNAITSVQIAFGGGSSGATATFYVDDIVVLDSTPFAEAASVAQTFSKTIASGSSPGSLTLRFHLEATPPLNVFSSLAVKINGTVEWSETPPTWGSASIAVDLSGNTALQGTGSFRLSFVLQLNRTGWEEASMTTWIDNVSLIVPGTLARVIVTPGTASVPLNQTVNFTAKGEDAQGNPVPLNALNWSSTIGQIVSANSTSAMLRAPATPGVGTVSAAQGTVVGTASVTAGQPVVDVPISVSIWRSVLWPGSALIAATLAAVGAVAWRRSTKDPFRIEEAFLIARDGRLVAHAGVRRDTNGDKDILAGMLTAVMSFAQDSFLSFAKDSFREQKQGLNRFDIGGKKVALERGEEVYVAAIGTGLIRPKVFRSLRQFLADVEGRYWAKLRHWSGMAEDLPGVAAMVQTLAQRGRYRHGDWQKFSTPGGPTPAPSRDSAVSP
jgi:hypothetical protein